MVQIDPQLLFQRLTVYVLDKHEDPKSAFQYELCSYPPALFDSSGLPRPPNKSVLADAMWNFCLENCPSSHDQSAECTIDLMQREQSKNNNIAYVLDGGALLQRVPWECGLDFQNLCQLYVTYVTKRYQGATIVFDGYENGPSIKDAAHQRRSGSKIGLSVNFTTKTVNNLKKDEFLANKRNKQRFINLLSESLTEAGCKSIHASGDADVLIVQTAVKSATTSDTVVVGDDTDLLVLLCFYSDMGAHDLYFIPEPKKSSSKRRLWDIKRTKLALGPKICSRILFIHAILGCDTVSQPYGIGKGAALKMAIRNSYFSELAEQFCKKDLSKESIKQIGEKALVALYNGSRDEGLDNLRYRRYCEKVAKSSKYVQPQSLPPTSASSQYHSLRAYYQIQDWKDNCEGLDPVIYGWKMTGELLLPIMTNLEPAPKKLLETVYCSCKAGCNTRRCTCRAHGLDCTRACGQCKGESCTNSPKPDFNQDDEL